MTIALAQEQNAITASNPAAGTFSVTTASAKWTANVTSGSMIIVIIFFRAPASPFTIVTGVSDSNSNSYSIVQQNSIYNSTFDELYFEAIAYARNVTGGNKPTITVNFDGDSTTYNVEVKALEFSGMQDTTVTTYNTEFVDSSGLTSLTSGSVTTALTSTLSISVMNTDSLSSAPSGYTVCFAIGGTGNEPGPGAAYRINGSALSGHNPAWGSGGAVAYAGMTAVFEGAGGAAAPSRPSLLMAG